MDILAGVKEQSSGEIEKSLNLKIGYFLQNSNDWFLAPTLLDDVVFTPLINGVCKEEAKERTHLLLAKFQVSHLESWLYQATIWRRKKAVALAGFFMSSYDICLLDEPFNGLDREKIAVLNEFLEGETCAQSQKELFAKLELFRVNGALKRV